LYFDIYLLTCIILVQLKNSSWYSSKPNGILFNASRGLSIPGCFSVKQKANLYNRFDLPCCWSTFMHVNARDIKSIGFESMPCRFTSFRKQKSAMSSKVCEHNRFIWSFTSTGTFPKLVSTVFVGTVNGDVHCLFTQLWVQVVWVDLLASLTDLDLVNVHVDVVPRHSKQGLANTRQVLGCNAPQQNLVFQTLPWNM